MKWSYHLFRAFGIDVRVHSSFLIFLGLFSLKAAFDNGIAAALYWVGLFCTVFVLVVLHEFGHSLTAIHFGVPVRDITLLPIGGVARLDRPPREPWHEFLIAIAGPAVNFVLAIVLLFVAVPAALAEALADLKFLPSQFLLHLWVLNVVLLVFNLIPAFPMDGGRVLRSLLAMRLGYLRATRIATQVSKYLCILLFVWGLLSAHWLLCFITVFLYLGALAELQSAEAAQAYRATQDSDSQPSGQPAWWSQYPSDGMPHVSQTGPFAPPPPGSVPQPDLTARYEELKARGEKVTPVYSGGRIIAVIRQTD